MTGDDITCALPSPGTIHTRRLALVPMAPRLAQAIMRKDWAVVESRLGCPFPLEWREDSWHWLAAQAAAGSDEDAVVVWGSRLGMPATNGVVVPGAHVLADVGFHGPPDPEGWVEIGYRVVHTHRRRGLAEEAASALLDWAAPRGVVGFRASVDPGNAASIALLGKLGFTAAGSHRHPVLGEQIRFLRPAATPPR